MFCICQLLHSLSRFYCLFSLNGKLYAVGGESYNWDDPQNTVECYDPRKNKWTFKANMHKIKGMCCAVVYNNKIYVVQFTAHTLDEGLDFEIF